MKTFFLTLLAGLLLLGASAQAAILTTDDVPADTSLSGSETFFCDQGGVTRSCTVGQVSTLVSGGSRANNALVVTASGASGPMACDSTNGTNGTDDSDAFAAMMAQGGTWYIPANADGDVCSLRTLENEGLSNDFTVYSDCDLNNDGATLDFGGYNQDKQHISLLSGARLRMQCLTIQNGGDPVWGNQINGTVHEIRYENVKWDNTHTWGIRASSTGENQAGSLTRMIVNNNIAFVPSTGFGFWWFGTAYEHVRFTNNFQEGGRRCFQIGFVENAEQTEEMNQRQFVDVSHNTCKDVDGNNFTSEETIAALYVTGRFVRIIGNVFENVSDNSDPEDTACIYTKAQHAKILGNDLINCGNDEAVISAKGDNTNVDAEVCAEANPATNVGQCAHGIIVANNTIYNDRAGIACTLDGMWIQSKNIHVEGNQIYGMTRFAVNASGAGRFSNISIHDNQVYQLEGCNGTPLAVFRVQNSTDNVSIQDNIVFDQSIAGTYHMVMFDHQGGDTIPYVTVSGNLFNVRGGTPVGVAFGRAGETGGTSQRVQISNNAFLFANNGATDGICIDINNVTVNNMLVNGNVMDLCATEVQGSANNEVGAGNLGYTP